MTAEGLKPGQGVKDGRRNEEQKEREGTGIITCNQEQRTDDLIYHMA